MNFAQCNSTELTYLSPDSDRLQAGWQRTRGSILGSVHTLVGMSRLLLGPGLPPLQRVTGALSPAGKRQEREVDYLCPSAADIKNVWSYTSSSYHYFVVSTHRNNFTFTFYSMYYTLSRSVVTVISCGRTKVIMAK